jgi:cell division protein FtsB
MAGHRPTSRGSRPRAPGSSGRPRGGPSRPGAPRVRAQAAGSPAAPRRPRFTGRAAILVLVLAVLMVSYASSMRAYLEQRHHLDTLAESIATSEANIAELEREKARWEDSAYVRSQARERFGWVLPGEIGYQVIDEDGKALGHDDSLTDAAAPSEEDERPEWWQAAWESVEAAGHPEELAQQPEPADRIRVPKQPAR